MRPHFVSTNTLTVSSPHGYRPHQHLMYELLYVIRGRYRCRVNQMPLELHAGQLLAVAPGDWHEDVLLPPLKLLGLHFTLEVPALAAKAPLYRPGIPAAQRVIACTPEMLALMRELQREPPIRDMIAAGQQDAVVDMIFWKLLRLLPREALSPGLIERSSQEEFVMQLRRCFEQHVHGRLPLPIMADKLGMSPSSLSSKCKARLGRTPAQAFAAAKIERARALLACTEMSVQDVSEYLGYADQFHFSKVFKRFAGVPPSRVRAK